MSGFDLQELQNELQRRKGASQASTNGNADSSAITVNDMQQELARRQGKPQKAPDEILPPWMSGVYGFQAGVQNVTEGALQGLTNLIAPDSKYAKVLKERGDERNRLLEGSAQINPKSTFAGNLTGAIGATVPAYLIPGAQLGMAGRLGSLARLGTQGAAQGAAIGAAQYVPEGGSRLTNTLIGAGLGAALPPAIVGGAMGAKGVGSLAKGVYRKFVPSPKGALDDAFYGVAPQTQVAAGAKAVDDAEQALKETLETKAAARELEVDISPAEASGNQVAAATQGSAGKTKEGALRMAEYANRRQGQEAKAVENILDATAPEGNYALNVKNAATKNIAARKQALQKAADPYYKAAENQAIPANAFNELTKSNVIAKALDDVYKTPAYADELVNFKPNTIKTLDAVKRNIGDQIDAAKRAGEGDLARMLQIQQKKLVNTLDKYSPTYKKARGIYAEDAPAIQALEESDLGVISKLKDKDVQRIPKIIFDKADDNIEAFKALRDEIYKQDPKAWNGIVRNYMRQAIDTRNADNTGKIGSAFYNGLIATDNQFNKLLAATANTPIAQRKILLSKKVFKNLIGGVTPRGAAAQAATSMSSAREALQSISTIIQDALGGKYDKALIDVITSPDWDKQLIEISKIKSPAAQSQRFIQLLDLANKALILRSTNPETNDD